jgi:flavin-dependent dehydrogenase
MVQRVTGDVGHGFQLTVQHPSEPVRQVLARVVLCAAGRHWRQPAAQNATTGSRSQQFLGLKVHVQNVPLNGSVELHTFRQGYCGLAEVDGGVTTVCCWGETDTWRHVGSTPDHFLAQCVQENPALQRRLRLAKRLDVPWTAVAYARRGTPAPLEDGMWKVGDCVAMIAPLTGDGMGMAMQAAEQAATLVLAAFRGHLSWAEASRTYERVWHREFSSRIRWGRRLEGVLRRPWSASLACMALGVMPSIMGALYGCTRDLRRSSTPEGEWRSRAAT